MLEGSVQARPESAARPPVAPVLLAFDQSIIKYPNIRRFPGGASTDFLLPSHLDLPLDFDTIMKAGIFNQPGYILVETAAMLFLISIGFALFGFALERLYNERADL